MNEKILIGSIIAVVILILVSFTGVVGYQTTKSSTIAKASPLFTVRSKRAIGEESKDITCDYIGKGEETSIHLSSRIKRAEQVQKVIDIISKMDDKAFRHLVAQIILNMKYQEQITGKEISDVLQALHHIRRNLNDMKYYDTKNSPIETLEYITCFGFPACIIRSIIEILIWTLAEIIWFITSKLTCDTPCLSVAGPTHWPCC
ncbi:MAG: hypothetical protein JSW06_01990 [Thermoplasmatales archaeon]|nr:MAG: hypothetical protein JSW06_01990 [Thermoplasmatales archaeon]